MIGLVNPENLQIFLVWYNFGGASKGISPMEAADMPADMRHDFMLMLSMLSDHRQRRKALRDRTASFGKK